MDRLIARLPFAHADLSRIESVGDNCELGFVLRRLGHEDGSLFRWSSIHADNLVATLKGDFDRFYEFDDLEPFTADMVRDRRYGTAWHSRMASTKQANAWAFRDSRPERIAIHAEEAAKRAYLLRKFRQKLDSPNPVFVVKSNAGIADDTLEALHYQLYRRIASPHFRLLDVRADPAKAGRIETIDRNLLRGYVNRFASYDDAEGGDDASWHSILAKALTTGERTAAGESSSPPGNAEPIVLRFPPQAHTDLTRCLLADVRAGVSDIHNGTEWCRLIEDDTYRLHGRGIGSDATYLRWRGVHVPDGWFLHMMAACAVPGTLPLVMTVSISDEHGNTATHTDCCSEDSQYKIAIKIPGSFRNPVTVLLRAEPLRLLAGDERAVADIAPIHVSPS